MIITDKKLHFGRKEEIHSSKETVAYRNVKAEGLVLPTAS